MALDQRVELTLFAADSSGQVEASPTTNLTSSQNGTDEPQSPNGLPAAPTGSCVENATSRFALPTPTLAVRNLVRLEPAPLM